MIALSKPWRRPFYCAAFFWFICVVLCGHFAEDGGFPLIVAYLVESLVFFVGTFLYALRTPQPIAAVRALVSVAPLILFGATVGYFLALWSSPRPLIRAD